MSLLFQQYILSGSDDFNLYMWKIPADPEAGESVPLWMCHSAWLSWTVACSSLREYIIRDEYTSLKNVVLDFYFILCV